MAWELKKDEVENPTPLQTYNLEGIKKVGAVGVVVHPKNFEEEFKKLELLSNS